jgi:hypothetical protein
MNLVVIAIIVRFLISVETTENKDDKERKKLKLYAKNISNNEI